MQTKIKKKISSKYNNTIVYTASVLISSKEYFTNVEVTTVKDRTGMLKMVENTLTGFFESYKITEIWDKIETALKQKYS